MASTTFRLFTRRQFQYVSAQAQQRPSYYAGLASLLSYSTKSKPPTVEMSLPKVFFDMTADGEHLGRITIEVRPMRYDEYFFFFSFERLEE